MDVLQREELAAVQHAAVARARIQSTGMAIIRYEDERSIGLEGQVLEVCTSEWSHTVERTVTS